MGMAFVDFKYIFDENRYFGQFDNFHIYGPIPFIWAYNQVSVTFRSKVLARTKNMTDRQTDGRTDTPNL